MSKKDKDALPTTVTRAIRRIKLDDHLVLFCPYCGSENIDEGRYRIYRCEKCRMKWTIGFSDQMKALPKKRKDSND